MSMKRVCLLGSTGSIGRQALDIIAAFPDRFLVDALSAHSQVELLAQQARRFDARVAIIMREELLPALRAALAGSRTRAEAGMSGLEEAAASSDNEVVLTAMVGAVGLLPLLAAVRAGKCIALANKEPLVAAGHLVMASATRYGATLLPVDSEPSAIFQCLQGQHRGGLKRILLTASGGALQHMSSEELAQVTPQAALRHPTWSMGDKITIDSATLMNKGLEVIEAHWLFGVPLSAIDIIIHPQSIVHSLIEFHDGTLLAQLGSPSMRTPIQYALSYPERLAQNWAPLDLFTQGALSFAAPDFSRFPAPALARRAALAGGSMPTCLNAANEVAVNAFLQGHIRFTDIACLVERALEGHEAITKPDLTSVLAVDQEVRKEVARWVGLPAYSR